MLPFTETHRNPWRWHMTAFVVAMPIIVYWSIRSNIRFVETRHYLLMLGSYLPLALYILIKFFGKTTYRIDEQGVHYFVKPFEKWQTISWFQIDRAYVRDFTRFGEHPAGIVGAKKRPKYKPYIIKAGPDGRVFDMKFDKKSSLGFQITKKTGGKIILGTQRSDELQALLVTLGYGV